MAGLPSSIAGMPAGPTAISILRSWARKSLNASDAKGWPFSWRLMATVIGMTPRPLTIVTSMNSSDAMLLRDDKDAAWDSPKVFLNNAHAGNHSQQHRPLPLRARCRWHHRCRLLSARRWRDDPQPHRGA